MYDIKDIYNMLTRQDFLDFHQGVFEEHIVGDPGALSVEEIYALLRELLNR